MFRSLTSTGRSLPSLLDDRRSLIVLFDLAFILYQKIFLKSRKTFNIRERVVIFSLPTTNYQKLVMHMTKHHGGKVERLKGI